MHKLSMWISLLLCSMPLAAMDMEMDEESDSEFVDKENEILAVLNKYWQQDQQQYNNRLIAAVVNLDVDTIACLLLSPLPQELLTDALALASADVRSNSEILVLLSSALWECWQQSESCETSSVPTSDENDVTLNPTSEQQLILGMQFLGITATMRKRKI